jgi:2-aminoadipate transaminase
MNYSYAERMQFVKPSAIRELLKLGSDPNIISFGGGYPDPDIFPIEELRVVFDDVLHLHGKEALQYTTSEGLPALRQKIIDRKNKDDLSIGMDNIFIVQGAQQGLDLVAKMLIDRGDVIITENPTFVGALVAFNAYEPQYAAVSMDEDGMIMDELEAVLKANPRAKFIYTVSDFQNPNRQDPQASPAASAWSSWQTNIK